MSLENSVDRIIELVDESHEKVKAKGGTTTTPHLLANLPEAIESIPSGEDVTAETADYTAKLVTLEDVIESLPEAGSGGGVRVEYGSVTPSSWDGSITVDGLDFTPSQVFVRLGDHGGGSITGISGYSRFLIAINFGNIDNRELYLSSTGGAGSKPIRTNYAAEIIENGFSIADLGSAAYFNGNTYTYIAIG